MLLAIIVRCVYSTYGMTPKSNRRRPASYRIDDILVSLHFGCCTRTERRLLHWSNIVGASHSRNYIIWQYGDYASRGVREVCEFGYPRSVQDEIEQNVSSCRLTHVSCLTTNSFKIIFGVRCCTLARLSFAVVRWLGDWLGGCLSRSCIVSKRL